MKMFSLHILLVLSLLVGLEQLVLLGQQVQTLQLI